MEKFIYSPYPISPTRDAYSLCCEDVGSNSVALSTVSAPASAQTERLTITTRGRLQHRPRYQSSPTAESRAEGQELTVTSGAERMLDAGDRQARDIAQLGDNLCWIRAWWSCWTRFSYSRHIHGLVSPSCG
jgi:hypothetical protein